MDMRIVYQLVPVSPLPPVFWNHRVGGNFRTWSLNLKGTYIKVFWNKDLAFMELRRPFRKTGALPPGPP
jgi:hypothetical protein